MRVFVLALCLTLVACSLPLKQKAVAGLQTSEAALEVAHDSERALCFNAPATESGPHCTNSVAAVVKLTDEAHVKAAEFFSKAFGDQIKAATALQAWKTGDPAPMSVTAYHDDLSALLALVHDLIPGTQASAQAFIAKIQAAVDAAALTLAIVGVH